MTEKGDFSGPLERKRQEKKSRGFPRGFGTEERKKGRLVKTGGMTT